MAVNTYGWDLVYAMKVPELNEDLKTRFNAEQSERKKLRKAIVEALAGDITKPYSTDNPNLSVVLLKQPNKAYLYTQMPSIQFDNPKGDTFDYQNLKPLMTLQKIEVLVQGSGYTSPPKKVEIKGTATVRVHAEANLIDGLVSSVNVLNGGSSYDQVSISIVGGGGIGATAVGVLSNGVLTAITLTNGGSGYTAAPSIVITDTGEGGGTGATATAQLGFNIQITQEGKGYTELPTLLLKDAAGNPVGGSGFEARIYMAIEDFTGFATGCNDEEIMPLATLIRANDDKSYYFDEITQKIVLQTGKAADILFTIAAYEKPTALYKNTDDSKTFLKTLFQAAGDVFVKKMISKYESAATPTALSLSGANDTDRMDVVIDNWLEHGKS